MITLVTGGSGSGKSQYAENLAISLNKTHLVYIATMIPYGNESLVKIKRHQEQRQDKKFQTIECFTNIKSLKVERKPTILLECMSNLLANEMYSENGIRQLPEPIDVRDEIMEGMKHLDSLCDNLVIVSNEVFSDGISYDDDTSTYIQNLGDINRRISSLALNVVEVVCGIPNIIKGRKV